MLYADTDGLLDRCVCGAFAGFERRDTTGECVRARCTECCEQTDWLSDNASAAVDWNRRTRSAKGVFSCPKCASVSWRDESGFLVEGGTCLDCGHTEADGGIAAYPSN